MFSAYHEYGTNSMALPCRPSGFYGPYTMDRNNYIEIHTTHHKLQKFHYDHLKLACKHIFQTIDTLYEKVSIEVEGKHFDLDILKGGDMKFLQLVLGLGGSLCNTTILFPTQLWELLYTYHVIKQCTEKETTSLSNLLLTIKLNYLHDLKIVFQCLLDPSFVHWRLGV
jgi:hypothetical protein